MAWQDLESIIKKVNLANDKKSDEAVGCLYGPYGVKSLWCSPLCQPTIRWQILSWILAVAIWLQDRLRPLHPIFLEFAGINKTSLIFDKDYN
jgi:hypothetical protein